MCKTRLIYPNQFSAGEESGVKKVKEKKNAIPPGKRKEEDEEYTSTLRLERL